MQSQPLARQKTMKQTRASVYAPNNECFEADNFAQTLITMCSSTKSLTAPPGLENEYGQNRDNIFNKN